MFLLFLANKGEEGRKESREESREDGREEDCQWRVE
jgi:hypothetical protein